MERGIMDIFSKLKREHPSGLSLDARIACFREILYANNTALGYIAEIQEAMESSDPLTAARAIRMVTGVTVQTYRMISNLIRMTGDRKYQKLISCFNALKKNIAAEVQLTPNLKPVGFVLPIAEVGPELAEAVGQKSAYLGKAHQILHGHVPEGFATTVECYRSFMTCGGLGARIELIMDKLRADDIGACFKASARIVQMIETAPIPEEVTCAITSAVDGLPGGPQLRVAVRSSALQEGGPEMSFAGLYRSILNISREGVVDAFRRVVASKYSPQAITYRAGRGFSSNEMDMCCCVITMVKAKAAGVLYTSAPDPSGPKTIIQAVRGLGLSAVDGSAEPDTITLDSSAHRVLSMKSGLQKVLVRSAGSEGTERSLVDTGASWNPAVTEAEALVLAELAWKLEKDLKTPLELEWAIDAHGDAFILQVRPVFNPAVWFGVPSKPAISGMPLLLDQGTCASGGAASGPVCLVESDLDMLKCPAGSIIVMREAKPRFAVLLPRCAALVSDLGEFTGHLATVARELRVPALFATRRATEVLKTGQVVTVDADAGVVYAGRVDGVLPSEDKPAAPANANRETLQSVAPLIVPLTLRDRYSSGYTPRKCKTVHDIIRFCHQATIEAMFDLGDKSLRGDRSLRRLVTGVPIDCRIFDLGGGCNPKTNGDSLELDDVICRPMRVLWKGMTDPKIHWSQSRSISVRGFMSAIVDYSFDLDARLRPMGEPSYVFVTSDYMNLNSRIGYHFSTVDARICDTVELNYTSFRFAGGSTAIEQRSRRALLLQELLSIVGFETDCRADLVNARLRHRPAEEMEKALFQVGLLMGYVNHLDMALVSDDVMKAYRDAFLVGDYGYKA
jgi:pyruvate,water dikinase